jgi:hypothetical protein
MAASIGMSMISIHTVAAAQADATLSPLALEAMAKVEAEIDRIEAGTFARLASPAG